MWALEINNEILLLDCGVMFPEADMLGVDLVLPDIGYVRERKHLVKGIVLTHGHEDHIGALPYILPELDFPPVYGTPLTLGIATNKLKEHRQLDKVTFVRFKAGEHFNVGSYGIEPFHVAHSIPDTVGLGITTSAGIAVYLTDWKFDHTPVDGYPTDIEKIGELGKRKPIVLITDCVRVESKGFTPSETTVGEAFDAIFATAPGRIIVATFASNISRVQQVIDSAEAYGRKVILAGRSMENNSKVATELGYLRSQPGTLVRASEINSFPDDQIAVVCTGSQGEPMAALARMANRDHQHIKIKQGDTVVVSATPIPGNEISVNRVINNLFRLGADVIYGGGPNGSGVHVSGHAAQEELKMVLGMLRPVCVVPFHGDYRHMMLYRKLALGMGKLFSPDQVMVPENGMVMEFSAAGGQIVDRVQAGFVYVDGTSVGDVGTVVVRDRQLLSRDGILMVVVSIDRATGELVAGPDVVTRGFVYMRQSDDLIEGTKATVRETFNGRSAGRTEPDAGFISRKIKDAVSDFLYTQTKRRPMVLPVVMEV